MGKECMTSSVLITTALEDLAKQQNHIKVIQIGKKETKLSFSQAVYDVYRKSKEFSGKLLKLITELSKVPA